MNSKGFLVYKCRRCGELVKNTGVPEGLNALLDITIDGRTRKEWGSGATILDTHNCKDGGIGISDLVGFESDELIEKKRNTQKLIDDAKQTIKSYKQDETINIEINLPDLFELVDNDKEKFKEAFGFTDAQVDQIWSNNKFESDNT